MGKRVKSSSLVPSTCVGCSDLSIDKPSRCLRCGLHLSDPPKPITESCYRGPRQFRQISASGSGWAYK